MTEQGTFTFTARNPVNPQNAVTLTLHDQHMTLQLGTPIQIETKPEPDEDGKDETKKEGLSIELPSILRPLANYALGKGIPPFHVSDVTAGMTDENGLWIASWLRTGGLRLSPIAFVMTQVDNPDGATAFVSELEKRKSRAGSAKKYPWLFDYWITWIVGFIAAFVVILRKLGPDEDHD